MLKKIVQITKDQESLEIQHRRHLRFEKRSEELVEAAKIDSTVPGWLKIVIAPDALVIMP